MSEGFRLKCFRLALAAALALSALYAALIFLTGLERGLIRTVRIEQSAGAQADNIPRRVIQYIGSESFEKERRDAGLPTAYAFEWTGIWNVPTSTTYDIYASADNNLTIALDGRVIVQRGGGLAHDTVVTRVPLDTGPHGLNITYFQSADDHLHLTWASNGSGPRPFGQADLYPTLRVMRAYHFLAPLKWAALASWLLIPAAALLTFTGAVAQVFRPVRPGWSRTEVLRYARSALLACVLIYAALLRFDALVGRWGVIPGSAGAESAQSEVANVVRRIRPGALEWNRSPFAAGGDPYAYLQQARERSHFYAAHLREPLFVFSVKGFLDLLGQADQAASMASAAFSWLTVLATYLLGRYAFSPWVGLGAALALSVERDVIGMGVAGYRDDAFGFLVLMVAWASLWVQNRPSYVRSALWGLIAGAACLTRLTALTFALPALGYLILSGPAGTRFRSAAVSLLVLVLVVSPFLINSWIAFGNPFFAVTGLWDTLAQGGGQLPATWSRYLFGRFAQKPVGSLDTFYLAALYSFQNKWQGFEAWSTLPIGGLLSTFASFGLLALCWLPRGRLLLLILVTSLAPYLSIWDMPFGNEYRYTLHAYPFFLIGAFVAVEGAVLLCARAILTRRLPPWLECRPVVEKTFITLVVVASGWLVVTILPYARMLEDLRQNGRTLVVAGPRDRLFFRTGWHAPVTVGNVTARFSMDREATVWVPMISDRDATLTVRLDPFVFDGAPPQVVRLTLNGTVISTFTLHVDPERFGSYSVEIPRRIVRGGLNRLDVTSWYSTIVGAVPRPPVLTAVRPATFAETHRALDVTRSVPTPDDRRPASLEATLAVNQRVGFRLWYVLVELGPNAT